MLDKIKTLREKTGAGVMDAKKALEGAKGDLSKATEIIAQRGLTKAASKSGREVRSGRVYSYIHNTGRVGAMVEIACETDFVANTEDFLALCKEVAMQVASMDPEDVPVLMKQAYIRDGSKTIEDLVKGLIAKTGENIKIVRFVRFAL
ncbi:translation elongation factor Ts [Candidatus Collierbacteria bacterium RIFCSPLOWO2_01_FULL_50_23]|uniref:Elongation factor Ts n=1 Tax=Candidatus Collierbacteria bacterium RIFCSPHIGHO2_01_FULL_50_25 TaxID=1817722 RepID=A0A1F5EVL2_9BACT|nr:MAG: translation elongation factor Ts [Candidatus Collierbacteria bacterium RIFCSPHIGHO2_01_FULL_50_25]OGD75297.1 MAG: translation elongation factor Ts [Candidatus Collierbacteria bacterium RIFCSPLOWO2_01_FULL_50_23]